MQHRNWRSEFASSGADAAHHDPQTDKQSPDENMQMGTRPQSVFPTGPLPDTALWDSIGVMANLLYLAFAASIIGLVVSTGRRLGWASGIPTLYLILFAIPRGPAELRNEVQPLRVALICAAVVLLLPRFVSSWRSLTPPKWLLAFGGILLLAALASTDPAGAASATGRTVGALLLFSTIGLSAPEQELRIALAQTIAIALGVTLLGLPLAASFERVPAPVVDRALVSGALGLTTAQTAILGFGGIATAIATRSPLALRVSLVVVSLPVAFLPMKRAIWFATAALMFGWLVVERRRWAPMVAVGIAIASALLFLIQPLRDLWDPTPSRRGATSFSSIRSGIFDAAIARFVDRPVLGDGLGVGNEELLINTGQVGFRWSAHTELATSLTATGVVGTVILAWGYLLMGCAVVRLYRDRGESLPLLVFVGSLALLPFNQLLVIPWLGSIGLLLIVLPQQTLARESNRRAVDAST